MSMVPLHTRTISLRLRAGRPGEVLAEGRLLDIRKRSIVPLGASLRGPGVVHDMSTRVWIDVASLAVSRVDPGMTAFPYVASPHTDGEACTGRIGAVQAVAGSRLDGSYAEVLNSLVGGPRGCFHIFTLLRLIGPAVVAALADGRVRDRLSGGSLQAAEGEVLWARCVTVDALKGEGLGLQLHGTLTDTFQHGGPPELGNGSEELLGGVEVMADLTTAFPDMTVAEIDGRMRRLVAGFGRAEPWRSLEKVAGLKGLSVTKGFSLRVQEVLEDSEGLRPESHLVFMMAPVVMQSLPGMLEEMQVRPGSGGRNATGTALNSCHMWRADGPLDRMTSAAAAQNRQGSS
jgi:hypothetical protein